MVRKFLKSHRHASAEHPAKPDFEVPPTQSARKEVASLALFLLAAILVVALLYSFIFRTYVVDGQSMLPTLKNSDRLIVGKLPVTFGKIDGHAFVPKRGDIVIFNQSNLPGYVGTKQLVKRVIGLPGDEVTIKNGRVIIYDSKYPKGFDPDTQSGYRLASNVTIADQDLSLKLGPKQIYVLGDNRQNSEDSRYFGPVNLNQVIGKLWLRFWPVGKTKAF